MESLLDVFKIIQLNCRMANVDPKDAETGTGGVL